MSGEEWSDRENDAIVADYFFMLRDELTGRKYNKAAHNRALRKSINRSKGSIEFKHQNISVILKGLGETWIDGYKPVFNFQMSLVDAVARHLQQRGGWLAKPSTSTIGASEAPGTIWIGPPPTLWNTEPPDELSHMQALARKLDPRSTSPEMNWLSRIPTATAGYFSGFGISRRNRGHLSCALHWMPMWN